MSSAPLYLFEQTDFSVRFARCASSEHPLRIDELKEVSNEETAAFITTLSSHAVITCASRPKDRTLHLASAEEAKRYSGFAGMRNFAELATANKPLPKWFAGVAAKNGQAPADAPWILSSSVSDPSTLSDALRALKPTSLRTISATIATAGALVSTASRTLLFIDVGESASHAMLVGPEGVLAAGTIALDLGRIGEAVQTELGLKFRGSAVKLFFNADYDFTDAGPKIAARLAEAIKSDLGRFMVDRPAPTELFVSGLPAAQEWFGSQLAAALTLAPHTPDLKKWIAASGITFANQDGMAKATRPWFPLLHLLQLQAVAKSPAVIAWNPEWISTELPEPSSIPSDPVVAPAVLSAPFAAASAVVVPSKPSTATVPPSSSPAVTSKTSAVLTPDPKASMPAPAPKLASAVSDIKPNKSLIAAAALKTPVIPVKSSASSVNASAKPAAASAPVPQTPAVKPAAAPAATAPSAPPPHANPPRDVFASAPSPKKKLPLFIALAAVVLCILGAGFFYVQSQTQAADQLALQKQQAEERLKAEEEKARLAELRAQEEAQARVQIQNDFAAKLLISETAREQAEAKAAAQSAARLANARGSLVITTAPAGATVTVGNLPPKTTPATFTDIKIGSYSINISLPRHEEVELELEVSENATTESGVIPLVALIGSLRINSEPGIADYELQPANALMVDPSARRSGQTPAALDDLSPGDYRVTLSREGWAPHTQVVSIARGATTHLRWSWPNALVKINSTPAGATVMHAGVVLGTTPLTLADQPPGETAYEVTLARFEPVQLIASAESGKTLELAAEFKTEDRLFTVPELDRKPEPLGAKLPELPYYLALDGGRVELELIVGRDGNPRSVSVVQASNGDLGQFCLSAVEKWQFKPGTKSGNPVNVTLRLPLVFRASR